MASNQLECLDVIDHAFLLVPTFIGQRPRTFQVQTLPAVLEIISYEERVAR
jgi:hypothetical protein